MAIQNPFVESGSSPFLLSAEVCSILRCSKRTLARYYKGYVNADGRRVRPVLGSVRRGGRILFAKTEVERFIAARLVVAVPTVPGTTKRNGAA